MKTIDEIKKEVAKECAEEHFEVIFEAEIIAGDYEQARRLWNGVGDRYIKQFENKNLSINTKEELSALIKEHIDIDTHRKMTDNYLSAEKAGKLLCDAMKIIAKNEIKNEKQNIIRRKTSKTSKTSS